MSGKAAKTRLGRIDRRLDDLITLERILASKAWGELCGMVVEALAPYPEARRAVVERLSAAEQNGRRR